MKPTTIGTTINKIFIIRVLTQKNGVLNLSF